MIDSVGWIGRWSPGIGDPTLTGWITVVAYVVAAGMVYRVIARETMLEPWLEATEKRLWWCLLLGLVALGVNKQLDLQTAFTELGRMLAHAQGWYEDRRRVQEAFIAAWSVMGLTLCAVLVWASFGMPKSTTMALWGAVCLVAFVGIRAASFHHVDAFINLSWFDIKVNAMIEDGALVLLAVGAWLRTMEAA